MTSSPEPLLPAASSAVLTARGAEPRLHDRAAPPARRLACSAHTALCLLGPAASVAAFWYAPLAWYAPPYWMPTLALTGLILWASAQCLALCLTVDLVREERGFLWSPAGLAIVLYWLVGGLGFALLLAHLEAAAQVWSLGGWIVTGLAIAMPIGDRLWRLRARTGPVSSRS